MRNSSSSDLLRAAQDAVEISKTLGANDAWVSVDQNRKINYEMQNSKLDKVEDSTSRAMQISLYVDGKYSSHSTTDIKTDRLKSLIKEAIAMTKALEADPDRKMTPPSLFGGRSNQDLELWDNTVNHISREKSLSWMSEMNDILQSHKNINSGTSGFSRGESHSASASSNGFSGSHQGTWAYIGASANLTTPNGKRVEGHMYNVSRHAQHLDAPKSIAQEALAYTEKLIGAEKVKSFAGSLVVDSRAAGSLLARFLSGANSRSIHNKQSFWEKLKGKYEFSSKLTLVDNPLLKGALGSRYFDNEGISAKELAIIDKGAVNNFYVDTYYGRKLGLEPTTGSRSNLVVTPGNLSKDALIHKANSGIYITSWLGGNADPLTGDFSYGLRGFTIKNGKLDKPVAEMNVTGNLKVLFKNLEDLGNDVWTNSSILSPSLLFADVSFSGA